MLNEKQLEALERALEIMGKSHPQDLRSLRVALEIHRDNLFAANSAYPATREFLESRGLTSATELDEPGLRDLRRHLQNTLRELKGE